MREGERVREIITQSALLYSVHTISQVRIWVTSRELAPLAPCLHPIVPGGDVASCTAS